MNLGVELKNYGKCGRVIGNYEIYDEINDF